MSREHRIWRLALDAVRRRRTRRSRDARRSPVLDAIRLAAWGQS